MRDTSSNEDYERLAIGVVKQAALEYRLIKKAMRIMVGSKDIALLESAKQEIEKFFNSEYGDILCFGKAKLILEELRKE